MKGSAISGIILASVLFLTFPAFQASAQDTDGDGMPDSYELAHSCLNVNVSDGDVDYDNDGMTSLEEYTYSSSLDPCNMDSDNDGLPDGWEFDYESCGFDPLTAASETIEQIGSDIRLTFTSYADDSVWDPSSVVWTGSEFGVSWIQDIYDGSTVYHLIELTRISAQGEQIGSGTIVSDNGLPYGLSEKFHIQLSWTGSEFGICWLDDRNDPDPYDFNTYDEIFFARASDEGMKIGSDLRVTTNSASPSYNPSMCWTGSEFGISWLDSQYIPEEISFIRISADGSLIGSDTRITTYSSSKVYPSIAWTGSEFGLAWGDVRIYSGSIFFTRISAEGSKIGSDIRISNYTSSTMPSLQWTGSEFGLSWYVVGSSNTGIHFARLTADGTKIGSDLRLTSGSNEVGYDSLLWTGTRFAVEWLYNQNGHNNIFLSLISLAGQQIGTHHQITYDPVILPPYDILSLAWTGSEFGTAWYDWRSNWYEIYFAIIGDEYDDADDDGLADNVELLLGTDPCNTDTDGDGLSDGDEVYTYLTDPTDWDTDGDYIPDGYEVDNMSNNPALDPLDPSDGATNFEPPSGYDRNFNYNEYWNGSDPWSKDPTPDPYFPDTPGCYYWGEGDGDGYPLANDLSILKNAVLGYSPDYSNVIPPNGDSQDLDADGYLLAGDISILKSFIFSSLVGSLNSRASSLEEVYEPSAPVPVGGTCHVTVKVRNEGGSTNNYSGSFSVVFSIDPSSTGSAVLLGGDGSYSGGRLDVSGASGASDGGHATMYMEITAPGDIIVNAVIPACGTHNYGRWVDEVELDPSFTITGYNP